MQMFNFHGLLTKFQIERFKSMQGFLGGCVNNIGDLAKCITTIVGVQSTLGNCKLSVKKVDQDPESNMMAFRSIYSPIDAARVLCEKMFEASLSILQMNGI